jgi:hypothetical protein
LRDEVEEKEILVTAGPDPWIGQKRQISNFLFTAIREDWG